MTKYHFLFATVLLILIYAGTSVFLAYKAFA